MEIKIGDLVRITKSPLNPALIGLEGRVLALGKSRGLEAYSYALVGFGDLKGRRPGNALHSGYEGEKVPAEYLGRCWYVNLGELEVVGFIMEVDQENNNLVTLKSQKSHDGFYFEAEGNSMLCFHGCEGFSVTTFGQHLKVSVASLEKINGIDFYQPTKEARKLFEALEDLEMEQDALADGLANSKAGSDEFKLYKDLLRKRDALRKIIRLFSLSKEKQLSPLLDEELG